MRFYTRENDIHFIKPLYHIANVLALVPPYDSDEGCKLTTYKCYSASMMVILILALIFSLHGRVVELYRHINPSHALLDFLLQTVMTVSICSAVLRSFANVQDFKSLRILFIEIDRDITKTGNSAKKYSNGFYLEVGIAHVIIIILIILDFLDTAIIGEINIFVYYILREFNEYEIVLIVLLFYNYVLCIRICLKNINESFESIVHAYLRLSRWECEEQCALPKNDAAFKNINRNMLEKIRLPRKIFNKAIKLVEILNRIFGWQILFLWIIITVELLLAVNLIIMNLTKEQMVMGKKIPKYHAVLHSFLWCCEMMVMGVVVAVICDRTTKEAQKTATVCYDLLLDVPSESNNVHDRILREELILLAQQATHQCPRFSAAGFFNVDYTMLYGLLGTVTSYIIVLIQINK